MEKNRLIKSKLQNIVAESVRKVLKEEMSDLDWAISYAQNELIGISSLIRDIRTNFIENSRYDVLTIDECNEIYEKGRMFKSVLYSILKKHWNERNKIE